VTAAGAAQDADTATEEGTMQLNYSRWERRDATHRDDLGRAALEYCRAQRGNRHVTGARYFWVDAGNTLAILVEGEPGFADFDPDPSPSITEAQFRMNDVARQVTNELWTDARLGLEAYVRAGRPSGVDVGACRFCNGTGSLTSTDVGGGEEISRCPHCDGTGRATPTPATAAARSS
jgi:hypothetical protein